MNKTFVDLFQSFFSPQVNWNWIIITTERMYELLLGIKNEKVSLIEEGELIPDNREISEKLGNVFEDAVKNLSTLIFFISN